MRRPRRGSNPPEELKASRVRVGRKWYWKLQEDYRFGEVMEIE